MLHKMNTTKNSKTIEYLSLVLVLSYFLIHNIYFVGIGIIVSQHIIIKNYINNISRIIKEKNTMSPKVKVLSKSSLKDKINVSDQYNSILTLVEKVEESGFIPSLDNDESKNIA